MTDIHVPSRWYEPRDPDDTDEARDREADDREQHDIDRADAERDDEVEPW